MIDGGHDVCAEELWNTLVMLNGSEEGIVIRAWLITHSHSDHYGCFDAFSDIYAEKVSLETIMVSLLSTDSTSYMYGDFYSDASKYSGAKILTVHTGMLFSFGDTKMEILFTPDELCIAEPESIDANYNNSSIVSRIYNEDSNCLFLGDAGATVAYHLIAYYGDYLKSDMCQVAHHGVEEFPLIAYRLIKAELLWYPCDTALYNRSDRDADVRKALRESKYTKEIILHDKATTTIYFE